MMESARGIFANMESSGGWPTPDEVAVALAEAGASRTMLARGVVLPSFFDAAIGAAITVQIATTALGLADIGGWAGWLLLAAGPRSMTTAPGSEPPGPLGCPHRRCPHRRWRRRN